MFNRSMHYNRDTAKADKQENWHKLLKIWLESKTYEEFIVAANVEVPKATKLQLLAFKVHHFAKEHPFAYAMTHMLFGSLIGFASMAISALMNANGETWFIGAICAIGIVAVSELVWSIVVGDCIQLHK